MRISKEIRDAIGHSLRQARQERRETQQQLADHLGLSRQMINRYEKGHDAPTAENLLKILRHLGIGIPLPGYKYTLTTEALQQPLGTPFVVPQQLTLELDKPQEVRNATVRILPKRDSIEIFISGIAIGIGER